MDALQGLAWFPGIEQLLGASFTLLPGVEPSVGWLDISTPLTLPQSVGPLTFTYGGVRIVLRDCRIETATITSGSHGRTLRLKVVDRRWKWRYGAISGHYNIWQHAEPLSFDYKQPGESRRRKELIRGTEQTPRQLCARLLDAMGERNYDLSRVPNALRPTVVWSYRVPAQALAELVARLGCRVVLRTDDTVAIVPLGWGRALPTGDDVSDQSLSLRASPLPERVVIVAGASRFQADLPLEAVGCETDGTIRPLDELSYRPEAGWGSIDLEHMNGIADPRAREVALASVFRWYRVAKSFTGALPKALRAEKWSVASILPLGREQLDTRTRNDHEVPKAAQVFGVWYRATHPFDVENSVASLQPLESETDDYGLSALYREPFTLDADRGIVCFAEPVYQFQHTGLYYEFAPAELRLRTSFAHFDKQTGNATRYEHARQLSRGTGAPAQFIERPDIVAGYRVRYDANYRPRKVIDNEAAIRQEADRHLDALVNQPSLGFPSSVTYVGLKPIELDGVVQQIEWRVGLAGATTRASTEALSPLAQLVAEANLPWSEALRPLLGNEPFAARLRSAS